MGCQGLNLVQRHVCNTWATLSLSSPLTYSFWEKGSVSKTCKSDPSWDFSSISSPIVPCVKFYFPSALWQPGSWLIKSLKHYQEVCFSLIQRNCSRELSICEKTSNLFPITWSLELARGVGCLRSRSNLSSPGHRRGGWGGVSSVLCEGPESSQVVPEDFPHDGSRREVELPVTLDLLEQFAHVGLL